MKKASEIVLDCLEKKKLSQRQLAAQMGEDVPKHPKISQPSYRFDDEAADSVF